MLPQELHELVPLFIALLPLPDPVPSGAGFDALALASVRTTSELPEACADEMVLVDGEHCPSLEYECLRFVDESSPSCAEYARKPECRHNTVSKRFCIDRHEWPNRVGERPQVFVTWREAQSSCESVGKRLCRRSEWTLACEVRSVHPTRTAGSDSRARATSEGRRCRSTSRTSRTRALARGSSSGSGKVIGSVATPTA